MAQEDGYWATKGNLAALVGHVQSQMESDDSMSPFRWYGLLAGQVESLPFAMDYDAPALRTSRPRQVDVVVDGVPVRPSLRLNHILLNSSESPDLLVAELFTGEAGDVALDTEQVIARVAVRRDEDLRVPEALERLITFQRALNMYIGAAATAPAAAVS